MKRNYQPHWAMNRQATGVWAFNHARLSPLFTMRGYRLYADTPMAGGTRAELPTPPRQR